jgi:hypothetical protein
VSFLARRGFPPCHIYVMVVGLMLLFVVSKGVEHAPATYVDSATIVFKTNKASLALNSNSTVDGSLITTDAASVESLMGSQARVLVRQAGGMANFNLSLANFDNQDFPDYSYPLATLTTQSASPAAAYRTFNAALKVLQHLVAGLQARVPQPDRISLIVVGATGPLRQPGSLKRSLAAIVLLTLIGMGMLSNFLNRNRNWLRILPRRDRPMATKHIPRHRVPPRQEMS